MTVRVEPTWVILCMEVGPSFETGDEAVVTNCRRQKGHTQEHEWWNDEGNVRLTWREGWHFDSGSWRKDMA